MTPIFTRRPPEQLEDIALMIDFYLLVDNILDTASCIYKRGLKNTLLVILKLYANTCKESCKINKRIYLL